MRLCVYEKITRREEGEEGEEGGIVGIRAKGSLFNWL